MSSSYREELDRWLKQLDVIADRVLDIGGAQLPIKGRTRSWDVLEYKIADLPQPHADSPRPEIMLDLNHRQGSQTEHYDLIFCLEVFDYIFDPVGALSNITGLLEPGGEAWVTFPSVYPLHQPVEDDALRYMPGGIKKLAEAAGLTIAEMIPRRPETNKWQEFFYAERMRGARNTDHSFTGWIVRFKK
jgi:SAM-dependent methyltransferase